MMKKLIFGSLVLALGSFNANAQDLIIDFDGFSHGDPVNGVYDADGVFFDPDTQGVCAGNSNGDPGGWGLEGTNGAEFLCFNGSNPGYVMNLTFSQPQSAISLDASRSNGSQDGDQFSIELLSGGGVVASDTITFDAINTWTTVSFSGVTFDEVNWEGLGVDFHPYGVDNIQLTQQQQQEAGPSPIPTLSQWGLIGLVGLLLLVAMRRMTRAG